MCLSKRVCVYAFESMHDHIRIRKVAYSVHSYMQTYSHTQHRAQNAPNLKCIITGLPDALVLVCCSHIILI